MRRSGPLFGVRSIRPGRQCSVLVLVASLLTACPTPGIKSRESGPPGQPAWADAEAKYRAAVQTAPDDARAQHALGLVLAQQGRLEEAIVHFEKAAQLRDREPGYWVNLGEVYHRAGRLDSAAEVYRRVLDKFPTWSDIGLRYVRVAADRRTVDAALGDLEALMASAEYSGVERTKVFRSSAHGIVTAYIDAGRQEAAIQRASEALDALQKLPMDSGGYHVPIIIPLPGIIIYGTSYTEKELIRPGSVYASFYNLRGTGKFRRGDYAGAAGDFTKSLEREPDGPADLGLGRVFLETGQADESVRHFQRFVDGHARNFLGRAYHAIALKRVGQSRSAEHELERIGPAVSNRWIRVDVPSGYESLEALALIDQTWGRTDEAVAKYLKVLELNPNVGAPHKRLGEIYRSRGDLEAARQAMKRALELMPADEGLARALMAIGSRVP